MWPDIINGSFETMGAITMAFNIKVALKDKMKKGLSWVSITFFLAWGYWNLFYWPHLSQLFSFIGGSLLVTVNSVWVGILVYYAIHPEGQEQ